MLRVLAIFAGAPQNLVILNSFQDNEQRWFVILKQVQDDEPTRLSTMGAHPTASTAEGVQSTNKFRVTE